MRYPLACLPFPPTLLLLALLTPAARADDWPQWLGPQRDGIWRESGILDKFPKDGPKVRWRTPIGLGYAGLPLAVGFADSGFDVLGIDLDPDRVGSVNACRSYLTDMSDNDLSGLEHRVSVEQLAVGRHVVGQPLKLGLAGGQEQRSDRLPVERQVEAVAFGQVVVEPVGLGEQRLHGIDLRLEQQALAAAGKVVRP